MFDVDPSKGLTLVEIADGFSVDDIKARMECVVVGRVVRLMWALCIGRWVEYLVNNINVNSMNL